MAEPRNHRIAERVDAPPVVEEVDAEPLAVARERLPERRTRIDHALEHRVGKRPHARARRVDRRAAPAVGHKLDVTSRRAFRRDLAIGAQRFEIGVLRRAERERAVVEHHADDDRAEPAVSFADAAARAQHVAFARSKRRDFGEEIPVAAGRLPPRRGVLGLGQMEGEPAHEPSIGAVQLDGRRQTVGREIGLRPHRERPIRRGPRDVGWSGDDVGERAQRIDLIERLAQPKLQFFALARSLPTVFGGDQALFRVGGKGEQRRVHGDRRDEERQEKSAEPRGLRRAAGASVQPRERRRARPGRDERDDERRDGHRRRPVPNSVGAEGKADEPRAGCRERGRPPVRRSAQRSGQPDRDGCAPNDDRVEQHETEGDGEPRGADRMQREMKHVEGGRRHDALQEALVPCQQPRVDEASQEIHDADACAAGIHSPSEQARPRSRHPAPLDGIERQPDQRRRHERRQQKIGGRGQRPRAQNESCREPEHRARDHEHHGDGGGRDQERAGIARPLPQLDERSGAQQQRDREDRHDRRPRAAAPPLARGGQIARRDVSLDEQAAAARRDHQGVVRVFRRRPAVGRETGDRPGKRTRSDTGTSEVDMTNVSARPGAPSRRPSDCSTTIVAARERPAGRHR